MRKFLFLILFSLCSLSPIFASNRVVNLTVGYKTVYFAGKANKAIAVNNQIPAPTLHFKEGDRVTINVRNLLDQETALHWHGVIVPWQMDGVLGISQQGIPAGGVFHYQFTLKQTGTYWYHAHAGLQEQQGLYGAFLIDPSQKTTYKYNKDYVVVLSDWSNTHPDQILANLKKQGTYYSPNFPLQPSLVKFIYDYRKASAEERQNLMNDYKMMQQMRMSIYDISDVAYDAFLLNGQPKSTPWTAPVHVGDTVRLRFIGAGGGTIFHVKIPNTTMQMVQVEGNDVRPYAINDFKIAPGETFDVLVRIEKNKPYIIYAESIDTVGVAYGALITESNQVVNYQCVTRFPEPLPLTREMMPMMMGERGHGSSAMSMSMPTPSQNLKTSQANSMGSMSHVMHGKKSQPMEMDSSMKIDEGMPMNHSSFLTSPGTKYQHLIAAVKTNDPNKPVTKVINMELFGYMDRFIWFINGVSEYRAHPILLDPGKRYRFVFTNTSMMHHPMHIHGHWFILRKGKGAYDPLLHTIDVPPGATITVDLDTDASGQWLFHCHLLYHMMSGMARVFQYTTLIEMSQNEVMPQDIIKQTPYLNRPIVRKDAVLPIDVSLVKHHMAHRMSLNLATFFDIGEDPFHNVQKINFKGLYGRDYDKLELFINDAEVRKGRVENADMDIFYWHLIDQFWAIKGGANYDYNPAQTPYWQPGIGIEGLMPYFIDTDVRGYFYGGSAKLDIELARDSQITNNFFIRAGVRSIMASKTVQQAGIGCGLNQMRYIIRPYYRLMPGLNVFAEYEHQQNYGAFRNLQIKTGESVALNTVTFGLSMLF